MHKHIEIDYKHSRAIVQKIGERLRTSLKTGAGRASKTSKANRPAARDGGAITSGCSAHSAMRSGIVCTLGAAT